MNGIEFKNSAEVIFYDDVSLKIKEYANRLGTSRALFITGKNSSSRIAEKLAEQVEGTIEVKVFSGVETNPKEETIYQAFEIAETFKPNLILTVGGGSAHDCGKATSPSSSNHH